MIDLRSDTLTKPTGEMRKAMFDAEVGDDARVNDIGRGKDPTVRALEELASEITGKEAALFCNSGTMANYIALITNCERGDKVLISKNSHIYRSEKAPFMEELFGLVPIFFDEDEYGIPCVKSIEKKLLNHNIKIICIENTLNFYGGTCIPLDQMNAIGKVANKENVPVYLDGARIFNASIALEVTVKELCAPLDSMMFCLSKGLGAPVGSLLCGSRDFIAQARKTRKLLGGAMRQAGILAAAGLIALKEPEKRLIEDHQKAQLLAKKIKPTGDIEVDYQSVQTNIVKVLVNSSKFSAHQMERNLSEHGLHVKAMNKKILRMTVYREINLKQINKAATIINEYVK